MPEPDGPSYQVHASGEIAKILRQIRRRAGQEGRGEQVIAALRELHRRLAFAPSTAGEPLYRLPALALAVRTIAVLPLVVDFAVSEERSLVFIKSVKLLSKR